MMSRTSHLLRAASALALLATVHGVAAAQNPAPAAAPMPAPAAPMTCDSACHARMGHGAMMGGMGGGAMQGGQMQGGMQGGMMMCPMMGHMQGMGMMGQGMMGMGGMQGMDGGPGNTMIVRRVEMGGPADTAAMRQTADNRAMMTRAYYEALVRRGFSAAQALQIVSSQDMPGR